MPILASSNIIFTFYFLIIMRRVLAIDDQINNLKLIKTVLNKYIPDCEVLMAHTGEEGIDVAMKELPDAILLDIVMPEMDGFQVCKILKTNKSTSHIPVVFISAIINDSESIIKGLDIGADAFITKPINPAELSAQVKVMLRIKQAEDDLKKESAKYRIITETSPSAIATIKLDGEITYASKKALEIFGLKKHSEILGKNAYEFIVTEDHESAKQAMSIALKKTIVKDQEFRFNNKDGAEFIGQISASVMKNSKDEIEGFIVIIDDITKRKNDETKLKDHQRRLKKLNSELILVEEKERRRIAELLHDGLGQTLSIAYINLSSLANREFPKEVKKIIKESSEFVNDSIIKSRSLTYDLSPPILYELGLIAALKWKLDQLDEQNGIETYLKSSEDYIDTSTDIKILLYRIVSELLSNVIKHAESDIIKVEINKDKEYYNISVIDKGKGFNYQDETKMLETSGFGLFSINERLETIRGKLLIDSIIGEGTKATISIPIKI